MPPAAMSEPDTYQDRQFLCAGFCRRNLSENVSDFMQPIRLTIDIITASWIVFVAVWLLAALTKRAVYRERRAQRLHYLPVSAIANT
jgi:hypothetical protein